MVVIAPIEVLAEGAHILIYTEVDDVQYVLIADHKHPTQVQRGWSILGGTIEDNETSLDAAIREVIEESNGAFDKAIEYKPDYGEALLNNARAHLAVGQYFSGLEQLIILKTIWPDTSVIYFTMGLIHFEMGENSPENTCLSVSQTWGWRILSLSRNLE